MVLVEACVFSGYDGVLKFGRDFAEWKEAVALVVRRAMDEGLNPALRLDGSGGWIDPTESDKRESSERPGKGETDGGGEKGLPDSDGPGLNGSQFEKPRPWEPGRA